LDEFSKTIHPHSTDHQNLGKLGTILREGILKIPLKALWVSRKNVCVKIALTADNLDCAGVQ
jgi:hypothetical protein